MQGIKPIIDFLSYKPISTAYQIEIDVAGRLVTLKNKLGNQFSFFPCFSLKGIPRLSSNKAIIRENISLFKQ